MIAEQVAERLHARPSGPEPLLTMPVTVHDVMARFPGKLTWAEGISVNTGADAGCAIEFLKKLHAETRHSIELRALPSKNRVFTRRPKEIADFLSENQSQNIYFGVATREGGGTKEHCRELPTFFCDVDLSDNETLKRIECFTPEPSIINFSGGGYHVYWPLCEPIDAHDPRVVPILKGISAALGADPSCAEIARVLRLPGTRNHKPKYTEPQAVYTLRENWDGRYRLEDFASFASLAVTSNGKRRARPPISDEIPEGKRRKDLLSMAGTMRRRGAGAEEIYAALVAINLRRCKPPLSDREVRELAEDIPARYQPQAEVTRDATPAVESEESNDLPQVATIPDMPESVLSGRLGELYQRTMSDFPRAYAWPALITCAGSLVSGDVLRSNLYTGLVGGIGTGKSQANDRSMRSLGIDPRGDMPPVMDLKAGSGEGLLKAIGDVGGAARLYSVDELGHLLEKAQIQNSSFPHILNGLFYNSRQKLRIARGEAVEFNCRLSVLGGLLEESFGDLFGKSTTGGLYDRFIFGHCPTNYSYSYRPFDGQALSVELANNVRVIPEVWAERDCWIKEIAGVTGRIAEIALRVAGICAAFDGKEILTVSDLAPARAFAEYQARIRILLRPNPGENFEARAAFKILAYLQRYAQNGQWVSKRDMLRETHSYELGPSICNKALNTLSYNGDVEEKQDGRKSLVRLII